MRKITKLLKRNRQPEATPPVMRVDIYSKPGKATWVKPGWAEYVQTIAKGGGVGAGGSGRPGTPGQLAVRQIPASSMSEQLTFGIGRGGAGGPGVAGLLLPGQPGQDGVFVAVSSVEPQASEAVIRALELTLASVKASVSHA